jgi:gamma-glutamyltranspeptidase/glutathione hydrolase
MSAIRACGRRAASCLLLCGALLAAAAPAALAREVREPAIASAHPLATAAGHEVFAAGGNAFDAAIAVAAALAVVEPYSSGLGGGGFFLLRRTLDGREVMLDARDAAPRDAGAGLYVDHQGRAIPGATTTGARAAAIPGTPAALDHLARYYARLPLAVSLAPALRLARHGFAVDPRYAEIAALRERLLGGQPASAAALLVEGRAPRPGQRLYQPDLAITLEAIAARGRDGFYAGPVAAELVASVRAAGGVWTAADLADYRVIEREPVRLDYRGLRITAAALPSSGGIVLAQALHILAGQPPADSRSPARAHLVAEALRRGFQDRALWLGDPDFVPVPVAKLVSRTHALARGADIRPDRATPSALLPAAAESAESPSTTHFSIVDADGNLVAATLTINTLFGSGFVAGRTGVLLNNLMDGFALPGRQPNVYGLIGGAANAIEPGKRPLSSMTPTFIDDERGTLVIGTPGGSRIISMLLLAILDHAQRPLVEIAPLLARPRYHHQYLPDRIEIEPGAFDADWIAALEARGHSVRAASRAWGNMQAVFIDRRTGTARAYNDPRGVGVAWY